MKKIIILILAVVTVAFAVKVSTGSISVDLDSTGGVVLAEGTNVLIGYLPPKAAIASVNVIPLEAFNATTNNFINIQAIYKIKSTNVAQTNRFVIDHSVTNTTSTYVSITNGFVIVSSNQTVPLYVNYEQSGATRVTNGKARIIVNYIQF